MADTGDERVLQSVAEWAVSNVVKKDGDEHPAFFLWGDRMTLLAEGVDGASHEVHGTDGVMKARMVGSWVHEVGESKLGDSTQALKVGVVDQLVNQRIFNGNKPINRVVNDFVLGAQWILLYLVRKNT